MSKSILITGCSSGIGQQAVKTLSQKGWQVFATARTPKDIDRLNTHTNVTALYLDYTDQTSIAKTADTVLEQTQGKLFALFNNGGYGQPGAVEDVPTQALRTQFETNVFGWHDLTTRLIPTMRTNDAGRIIQCSSILGFFSPPYRGAYAASKYAIEALTDAMRLELRKTNIEVCLIEPGPIRTKFIQRAIKAYQNNIDLENSIHANNYKDRIAAMQQGGKTRFKLEPECVVAKLEHALTAKNPKSRYYVTVPTYAMAYAKGLLPTKLVDRLALNN